MLPSASLVPSPKPATARLAELKKRLPLLEFLRQRHWQARRGRHPHEWAGLCPWHQETRPSFYVNSAKNLFYCHGCGRGGDLIRFVELAEHLSFARAVAYLQQHLDAPPGAGPDYHHLLQAAAAFFQLQLHRHPEAVQYLAQRGLHHAPLLEELAIGYAPGNLCRHLLAAGFPLDCLRGCGLMDAYGRDAFYRRVIFPCRQDHHIVNLYGRSIGAAFPHRLLPRSKGGLFAWDLVRQFRELILVEGLFDLAVLWQAGFRQTTSALGTHLTATQLQQLTDPPGRSLTIVFDTDANQAGQQAAGRLARQLEAAGVAAAIAHLPAGLDPNHYFAAGATAADFAACLQDAQRL
jgi:DNA primase